MDEPTFKETEWTLCFFCVRSQLFILYSSDKVRADVIFEFAVVNLSSMSPLSREQ